MLWGAVREEANRKAKGARRMNDIANKKTKRILEDLLSDSEIRIYNLSEELMKMETQYTMMKEELQRTEKLVGDIESVLRGMGDD